MGLIEENMKRQQQETIVSEVAPSNDRHSLNKNLRISQNPPSQPSKQLHSRASVQFPCTQPGKQTQMSQSSPSQPISQAQ